MPLERQLSTARTGAIAAVLLLLAATTVSLVAGGGQEPFEVIRDPQVYSAEMLAAAAGLRAILFIDSLFIIAYTTAIGMTAAAFSGNHEPSAWIAGIGILLVALLDVAENSMMVQTLDMTMQGATVTVERISAQAFVSALKWQSAALALFAMGFVLPSNTMLEKLLVWGVRLGLPLAVPLFVMDAFSLRDLAPLLIGLSMLGGLLLLAAVLGEHLERAQKSVN